MFDAELAERVKFVSVSVPALEIPPPLLVAELPEKVEFATVRVVFEPLEIPPPLAAVLPATMVLKRWVKAVPPWTFMVRMPPPPRLLLELLARLLTMVLLVRVAVPLPLEMAPPRSIPPPWEELPASVLAVTFNPPLLL